MNSSNPHHRDTSMDSLIIAAFCLVSFLGFGYLIWMKFGGSISVFHINYRALVEFPFYSLYKIWLSATHTRIDFLDELFFTSTHLCHKTSLISGCNVVEGIKFNELMRSAVFGNIIFSGIAILIVIKGYFNVQNKHPAVRFARQHDLESFMEEQKVNYPHLRLYADFNLQKVDFMSGPLMGMKTTREFAKENKLVKGEAPRQLKYMSNGVTRSQKDEKEKVPVIDTDALLKICKQQLGKLWVDVASATDGEIILLAKYLPIACSTSSDMSDEEFLEIKNEAIKLEDWLWDTATNDIFYSEKFSPIKDDNELQDGRKTKKDIVYPDGKKTFEAFNTRKLAEQYVEKYINHPVAVKLLRKHMYTRTFIFATIVKARTLGVNAPCQLRWLKFYDRELWAMLSNIGRPSFFCENMGVTSHFEAESISKDQKGLVLPNFEVAIKGFQHQLQSYLYTTEDMQDLLMNEDDDYKFEGDVFSTIPSKEDVDKMSESERYSLENHARTYPLTGYEDVVYKE
ncbi:hypothetical protein A7M79_07135 [Acinetobacter baumannii]|nr:hypothetical protein A7M79_07135 [Acinetobacter baumannii]